MEFNNIEQQIIQLWEETQLKDKIKNKNYNKSWEFLDGPPFINGSPHHGHLLVSSIKDTIARYMNQKGYSIKYQIGFDCHGLPLEQEAEKQVGKVNPSDSIEKLTVFNDECRKIISSCSNICYDVLERLGRQFDKSQTYYTSDFKYMESLWWAYKKLWDDKLIYRSKKVMPYSPLCETPLSNFEASSNYQDRTDIAVYVIFKLVDKRYLEHLLIWTTTPWSLFANQGICVNGELDYNLVQDTNNKKYWICSDIPLETIFNDKTTILNTIKGIELVGRTYEPIFKLNNYSNYKIYADNYVTNKAGTGLVHLAPLFGNDDMRVMKLNGYTDEQLPEYLIDTQCKFKIDDYSIGIINKFVIDTSTDIVIYLKTNGYAIKSEKIKHSYPHCWRTDHPLIYLSTDAWFLNVQKIIPELVENNKKIKWYPEYVGTERFANWIKDSPDWCLSRNRVWGTPIPVWENEHGDIICIGSVKELEEYTGRTFNDLHLDKIGNIEFTTEKGTFKRTFGVLDCLFESGMAGLSRYGYPECNNQSYPVDFITESIDQTRGWFYTLNVLSTALNHTPAFKSVIVSGLILAEDGKKMSKRLGNYTSPDKLINTYGVDVLRLYLIGSPAAKAESFCFKDSDLVDIMRKLLPYYHSHMMFVECITYAKTMFDSIDWLKTIISANKIDLWIYSKYMEFAKTVYNHMEKLEITFIPKLIFKFIDYLCNIFIKLSRDRMKGLLTEMDCKESLSTLYTILSKCNVLLAPYIPHLAEYYNHIMHSSISQNNYESIHLQQIDINNILYFQINDELLNGFYSVNELLESVRNLRQQSEKPMFYPIGKIELYTESNIIIHFEDVICRELNAKQLIIKPIEYLEKNYKANKGLLGKQYKKDAHIYVQKIESGDITWDGCIPEYYTFTYNINLLNKSKSVDFSDNKTSTPVARSKSMDLTKSLSLDLSVNLSLDLSDGMSNSIDNSENTENNVGMTFNYMNQNGIYKQSIVYIDTLTTIEFDIEAEHNNIRRQINEIRKTMGIKIFNKVEITFEKNDYWNEFLSYPTGKYNESLSLLSNRLNATIKFQDKLKDYNIIKTFNNKILYVSIKLIINLI
jgi:isoleucyl-tRNA synthetase